ncbi:MAG TPA: hypothetical protein VNK52_09240 [Hyphomicrobiaceae bacterium]|nr:hypothetical protein [Hyphomicrobiaceae bacterium]
MVLPRFGIEVSAAGAGLMQIVSKDEMNLAFQIDTLTNSDGEMEIVRVECEPTEIDASHELAAEETGTGVWEFEFVVDVNFDGGERVFRAFRRYGLDPGAVYEACAQARQDMGEA